MSKLLKCHLSMIRNRLYLRGITIAHNNRLILCIAYHNGAAPISSSDTPLAERFTVGQATA